jgi:Domain of unknown function (DUF4386)
MNTNRNIAIIVGVLFILTEITSITGLILYDPILHDPDYIIKGAANETRVLWGAFFEVLLVFTQIGTAITLFPILKKYNESMAIGTVCFRLLEATIVIIGIMSLLAIVTLNHEFLKEANPNTSTYLVAGKLLLDIHNWTFLYGPNLILGPSSFMTAYLLYKSKLVPRFVTFLGLVGGPLISVNALLVTFGVYTQLSAWGMVLAIPVFAYEVSLAIRLLVKGFNSAPATHAPVQNLFKLAGRQV